MAGRKKVRKDSRGRQFRVGESFIKIKVYMCIDIQMN